MPEGVVTFTRCHIPDEQIPNFRESNKLLRTPVIRLEGTIEDCTGAEQVKPSKYITVCDQFSSYFLYSWILPINSSVEVF